MTNNNLEKLPAEEWMYMIFDRDRIIEKTTELTKEAEKRGMGLTEYLEYLESISPLNHNPDSEE